MLFYRRRHPNAMVAEERSAAAILKTDSRDKEFLYRHRRPKAMEAEERRRGVKTCCHKVSAASQGTPY